MKTIGPLPDTRIHDFILADEMQPFTLPSRRSKNIFPFLKCYFIRCNIKTGTNKTGACRKAGKKNA